METLAILAIKGGVGKTTTAAALGGILATEHKARVPLDLYERLQAAEERLGIDRSNRGRFYAFLLAHALDELDAGRLEVPRREKADL